LGREQLKRIPSGNARRAELVRLYREMLAREAPSIRIPFQEERGQSSYHILPALLPAGADKHAFMERMKAQGIQTSWHYPPVHRFSIYKDAYASRPNPLPVSDEVAERESNPAALSDHERGTGWLGSPGCQDRVMRALTAGNLCQREFLAKKAEITAP
ncbi:MAG TPA: DegT/DnrJ/EryC1/StrS family aminotransferase, partial [Anaerolineaceae bacterium]|nr:DegT/DnrJ/EryC1/StrS family aminotransferase [Anaerolineaceae bacterium]